MLKKNNKTVCQKNGSLFEGAQLNIKHKFEQTSILFVKMHVVPFVVFWTQKCADVVKNMIF